MYDGLPGGDGSCDGVRMVSRSPAASDWAADHWYPAPRRRRRRGLRWTEHIRASNESSLMIVASAYIYYQWGQCPFSISVLYVKALVGTINQEKALVVITNICVDLRLKL